MYNIYVITTCTNEYKHITIFTSVLFIFQHFSFLFLIFLFISLPNILYPLLIPHNNNNNKSCILIYQRFYHFFSPADKTEIIFPDVTVTASVKTKCYTPLGLFWLALLSSQLNRPAVCPSPVWSQIGYDKTFMINFFFVFYD